MGIAEFLRGQRGFVGSRLGRRVAHFASDEEVVVNSVKRYD